MAQVRDGQGEGVTTEGYHEGDLCGDRILLCLDCGGSYMNLHM